MGKPTGIEAASLLSVAFALLEAGERTGDPAFLRRAVSTAYYAMFHCLARTCADRLVRDGSLSLREAAWRRAYRSLEHAHARRQCSNEAALAELPDGIRRFGRGFIMLHGSRRKADYDTAARFKAQVVRQQLRIAAELVHLLEKTPADDQREFAALVLLPTRRT